MMDDVTVTSRIHSDANGVVLVRSAAQWAEAGVSRKKLRLLVESGDLVRVRHGCYAIREIFAEAEADPRLEHAIKVGSAIVANRSRGGVASHHSAARVHGVEMLHPPSENTLTITVGAGQQTGRGKDADVVLHSAELPDSHVTEFRGLPVTTVARTVADIARISTFAQGVVAADSAMRRDPNVKPQIRDVLRVCRGWPGVDLARKVAEFAEWVPETPLESAGRAVFSEHGLPPPVFQAPILGKNGRLVARTDFCWPEYGAIAEADGADKYLRRGDLKRDHQRDSRIREVGWEVAHFLWDELFAAPAEVVARVRFAFERGMDPVAVRRRAMFPQAVAKPGRWALAPESVTSPTPAEVPNRPEGIG